MKITARFDKAAPPASSTRKSARTRDPAGPSFAARNLALAHHLENLIERGLIADYTAAAQALGVSQPHLSNRMGLLLLAPDLQAAILLGEMEFGDKELRALARIASWDEQKAQVARRNAPPRVRLVGAANCEPAGT
jgi:hypothetical protein